jgi:uncharacterized membrane protein
LFLKYAFENNWIGPAGRVSIGLLAGIAVVTWSERFRARGYALFSYSLKAVGIGTMYLSLWGAFQIYHLISGELAFVAMVLVTASTAVLALTQEAQTLAVFALVGGFATPLLLSTGQNHELVLFCYVALLDAATLFLVAFRPWMWLTAGSFAGTAVLYTGWYAWFYDPEFFGITISFATLFFVIFVLAPLFALRKPVPNLAEVPRALVLTPLLNAAAYFFAVYLMLEEVNPAARAWVAVLLAAVYLALCRHLHKRADGAASRILKLLYLALAVGFLTIAIPLKLETHWITLGWLAESAVLLGIAYRVSNLLLKVLATGALALGVARLLIYDNFHPAHLILNARFVAYLVAIAALAWGLTLVRDRASAIEHKAAAVAIILINILGLLALSLETNDYFRREIIALQALRPPAINLSDFYAQFHRLDITRDFAYSAVWMVYGAALMWVGFWKRSAFLRWQALVLVSATILKVFLYDTLQLDHEYRIISFIALGVLLLAISFIYQRDWLRLSTARAPQHPAAKEGKRDSDPA